MAFLTSSASDVIIGKVINEFEGISHFCFFNPLNEG
ncbi:hypothetical protein SDD27957_00680 [Streptococcus dysgalactiae subsp. dysgalactiae ATCC 27957]|nr:hypothetical protein SDD27957_00680 [Streptococcus dysgalactiae subsp. dysgalactiae ATCC 27957]